MNESTITRISGVYRWQNRWQNGAAEEQLVWFRLPRYQHQWHHDPWNPGQLHFTRATHIAGLPAQRLALLADHSRKQTTHPAWDSIPRAYSAGGKAPLGSKIAQYAACRFPGGVVKAQVCFGSLGAYHAHRCPSFPLKSHCTPPHRLPVTGRRNAEFATETLGPAQHMAQMCATAEGCANSQNLC